MNNIDIKKEVISILQYNDRSFRKVNDVQYVTRCPFCGDSADLNKRHFYIRIGLNDNYLMVYKCFKCPAQGIVTADVLEYLGVTNKDVLNSIKQMNLSAEKFGNDISNNDTNDNFIYNYSLPEVTNNKINYIENRLDIGLDLLDIKRFRVITSLRDFLIHNKIKSITCKPSMARLLERDYIGFLTHKKSHIIFRDITNKNKLRWYKYSITDSSTTNPIKDYYSIETDLNLFTDENININLSEGIMDCISIYCNLHHNNNNDLNIAVLGKDYYSTISDIIKKGLAGSNININIFSDKDHTFDTSIEWYKKRLNIFRYIVGNIFIYYNSKDKDFGVPVDKIRIKKIKLY